MNKTYLQLIELVRRVLKNDLNELNKELFSDINDAEMWKQIYGLAGAQDVQVFLYEATQNIQLPENVKNNFYSVYNRAIRKEAIMHLEVSGFLEKLEKSNIEAIPLKGWNIKNLYEKPFLRTMTDVDILVKKADFERACKLIEECGFELDHIGVCNNAYKKPPVTQVEVHHRLFKEESVLHAWSQRIISETNGFGMGKEDSYVYFIAHLAKHFTWDGAGMRNIVDCYLLNKKEQWTLEERQYIESELKMLGLDIFEKRMRNLCDVWFENNEYDADTIDLTVYIMDGGLYGKQGNAKKLKCGDEDTKKSKWIMRDVFPDFETLKLSLGYKKMYKPLMPVYWIIRLVRGLFFRKGTLTSRVEVVSTYEETVDKSKSILEYMGLNTVKY